MTVTSRRVRPIVCFAAVLALVTAPATLARGQHHAAAHHNGNAEAHAHALAQAHAHAQAQAQAHAMAQAQAQQQAMQAQQHQALAAHRHNGTNHAQANQNSGAMVSALHASMSQLSQADRDYQGHRARAMHEISTAIHHLGGQAVQPQQAAATTQAGTSAGHRASTAGHSGKSAGSGTVSRASTTRTAASSGNSQVAAGGNGQRMPQATSDAYLRQAQQSLTSVESQMGNTGGGAQNHAQARASVQRAIQELNVALSLR